MADKGEIEGRLDFLSVLCQNSKWRGPTPEKERNYDHEILLSGSYQWKLYGSHRPEPVQRTAR